MSLLPNWGFRNTVHAYHSEDSVKLPLKSITEDSQQQGKISLDKFVSTRIPEIIDGASYNLKPYLFTGTLQTLYTFKADFHLKYPVYFAREIITITEDESINLKNIFNHLNPGEFTLDYVVDPPNDELDSKIFKEKYLETLPKGYPNLHPRCRYYTINEMNSLKNSWLKDNQPISIIVPGLAGGIQEAPVRATCYKLHKQGHHVLVLNQRGCSRSKITTPYLYTGLSTDDIKFIIHKFYNYFGNNNNKRQFHAIGYSFGGLQIANYLIKEGKDSKLTSAVTISSPWDLNESMSHINNSLSGVYLFQPAVVYFLLKMVKSNMEILNQNSEIFSEEKYNKLKKKIKTSVEFDDEYTCKLVGLPSGKIYYYAASPLCKIFQIKTPLLIINSKDDPMISTDYPYLEVKKHPWIYMATSDLGGHYSFIKNNGDFWFPDVVENWIDSWKELDVQTPHDIDDNGWDIPIRTDL
ncbi:medium-chain fatty acid ethyl ester synthase/esterase 2 [Pichia californica]|uniref:Medium-chain fatty acid ethyl ester synthase/esterase 2 n=1 Tax=Pichia californica TaxID=460514 RepID=A0A9P7BD13_9ASCO|nr:medium-chain fatty acid ethyl ester synthase/esterase 2 [[Candida] californica]